jgi:flagellar protein FlgJ
MRAASMVTETPASVAGTVRHMAGVLWDNMLSEMNKSGLDSSTLGPGGDQFQSLFMWNIAQNDFSSYDTQLVQAALKQLGGQDASTSTATTNAPPAGTANQDIAVSAPLLPAAALLPAAPLLPAGGATAAAVAAESLATAPEATLAPALGSAHLLQTAKDFAKTVWPALQQAAAALGVPAVGLLAQAALESQWGTAAPGHNLFGIKASPGQPSTWAATHEMQAGVLMPAQAAFRAYGSTAQGIADYVGEIRSAFPQAAGQGSVSGFAQALQAGGYATDRNYAAKLIGLANSPLLAAAVRAATEPAANQHSTKAP